MKYKHLVLLALVPFLITAQSIVTPVKIDHHISITPDKWIDNDLLLVSHEPYGTIDGLQKNNGDVLIGIEDSSLLTDIKYYLTVSSDTGKTFTLWTSALTGMISKSKLICTSNDNVYSFFVTNDSLYCWDLAANIIKVPTPGKVMDYNVAKGLNNSIHIFYYDGQNIHRIATTNGGASWSNDAIVCYGGGYPALSSNSRGDILLCSFYNDFTNQHYKSPLYCMTYTCSPSGELTVYKQGYLTSSADTLLEKTELKNAVSSDKQMVLYAAGPHGGINIYGGLSNDSGATFSPFTVANSTFDEYWMDIKSFNDGRGFDIVYYADSLQTGTPNSNTDYLQYFATDNGTLQNVPRRFSNHIPFWSPNNYKPKIIEMGIEDCAIVWVGLDNNMNKGVYYNRYSAPSSVNEQNKPASNYTLNQNYPNPFNPSTTISFSLLKQAKVSLKVYDAMGREVANLLNETRPAGNHSVRFNGAKLSSGVYFYKLCADGLVLTKKMLLLK